MLMIGTEGISPIQKKAAFPRTAAGAERSRRPDGKYDRFAPSDPLGQEERRSFLDAVSDLSRQVRTANTTGKIQELRAQVSAGEYRVDAREVAARMLLMEVEE